MSAPRRAVVVAALTAFMAERMKGAASLQHTKGVVLKMPLLPFHHSLVPLGVTQPHAVSWDMQQVICRFSHGMIQMQWLPHVGKCNILDYLLWSQMTIYFSFYVSGGPSVVILPMLHLNSKARDNGNPDPLLKKLKPHQVPQSDLSLVN